VVGAGNVRVAIRRGERACRSFMTSRKRKRLTVHKVQKLLAPKPNSVGQPCRVKPVKCR
jgi:hypothetical protein